MPLPDNVCVWVEGIALWSVCDSPLGEGRPSVLPLLPAQTVDDTGFPFMVFNKLNNVFRDISLFRTYFVV